jgi:hypothetical protein
MSALLVRQLRVRPINPWHAQKAISTLRGQPRLKIEHVCCSSAPRLYANSARPLSPLSGRMLREASMSAMGHKRTWIGSVESSDWGDRFLLGPQPQIASSLETECVLGSNFDQRLRAT